MLHKMGRATLLKNLEVCVVWKIKANPSPGFSLLPFRAWHQPLLLLSVEELACKPLRKAVWMKNCNKHHCLCEQREFKCKVRFTERGLTYKACTKLVISLCDRMFLIQKFTQANLSIVSSAILLNIHIVPS